MIDISSKIDAWRKHCRRLCGQDCKSGCKERNRCQYMRLAEVYAHIDNTIPAEYRQYTIDDFTGFKEGKQLLKEKLVAQAKEVVVNYCWDGIEDIGEYDVAQWFKKSVMDKRRHNGQSLIIYGNPWQRVQEGAKVKAFRQSMGRTMLAGIVMKEAIHLRLRGTNHLADRYAWVAYHTLCNRMMEQAKGNEDYNDEIWHYENADWMVVDGLEMMRDAGTNFRASVLDKLFGERLDRGLPSILVFQDDISEADDLRGEFGVHINSIINSPNTFVVRLLEK